MHIVLAHWMIAHKTVEIGWNNKYEEDGIIQKLLQFNSKTIIKLIFRGKMLFFATSMHEINMETK